jgi:hypothetical protein
MLRAHVDHDSFAHVLLGGRHHVIPVFTADHDHCFSTAGLGRSRTPTHQL